MQFPRQEYWSGLPFPSPGVLPNPGIKPKSPASPALAGRFSATEPPGKPIMIDLCSCSIVSDSLWPPRLQHARLPYPSLSARVCPNSCPLSKWCYKTISSSVTPFSSCLWSFPASGSLPMSWFFASGGQSITASASVLPMNIQDWVL